jgi:hypothetical protein
LTPHVITLVGEDGRLVVIPPEKTPARCEESAERVGELEFAGGIVVPLVVRRLGKVENLPPGEDGVLLVVSYAAAQSARRRDLVVPADLVRDERGRVIGCRALSFLD